MLVQWTVIYNIWLVFLIYSTFQFSQKVFLFCSKLARKGSTAQLAWKKGTPFCKMLMFKNHYFVVVHACYVVLKWFNNFLKIVSWGALHTWTWTSVDSSLPIIATASVCVHLLKHYNIAHVRFDARAVGVGMEGEDERLRLGAFVWENKTHKIRM